MRRHGLCLHHAEALKPRSFTAPTVAPADTLPDNARIKRRQPISDALSPEAIRRLLAQLARGREQLRLQLPNGGNEPVLFDASAPEHLDIFPLLQADARLRALQAGEVITLCGQINGAPLTLQARVAHNALDSAEPRLRCAPPHGGQLRERREAPRFPIPEQGERTLTVIHLPGEVLLCHLRNISRGGLCLRLDAGDIDIGEHQVALCEIRRGNHLLQSQISIRWRAFRNRHLELGARFLERESAFNNRLDRFVAEIERHWLAQRH